MFRSEPAVAEFDGPFTPTHKSREGIVGHQLCQASTHLSARFTLLACRSLGFGSCPLDSPRLNTVSLAEGCARIGFPAPSPMLGLDSPSGHTPWFVFQNVRRNIGSSRVLLWVRTRVVFREALYAPSLDRHLISSPIAPPFSGCFSAFAHATCSLSVSRRVESWQSMPAGFARDIQPPLLWS